MTKIKPRVLMKSKDRIEYVLDGVCRYYDISREELLRRARTPSRFKRKRIAVKLLRDEADCSFKDIMYAFGNTGENNCWIIHRDITEDLNSNLSLTKPLRDEYEDIKRFLQI